MVNALTPFFVFQIDYDEDDENCPIINVNTVPNFGTDSQGEEEEEPKRKEAEKEHQEDNMTSQENQGKSTKKAKLKILY